MTDLPAVIRDDAFVLNLPCGRVALIDAADAPLLSGFKLYSEVRKHTVYVQCHKKGLPRGRYIYLHVLVTGRRGDDHRDGDGLNNRRGNLRPATVGQNTRNGPKRSEQNPFKGLNFHRATGKWRAQISIDYKKICGPLRITSLEAAMDYDELAARHHGEFARLNFPVSHVD